MTEGDITTWVTDRSVFSSDVIPALIDIKNILLVVLKIWLGKLGKWVEQLCHLLASQSFSHSNKTTTKYAVSVSDLL